MSFVSLEDVGFRDISQLDAFGRLRTSSPNTLFESMTEYFLSSRFWDTATVGGGSSVAHSPVSKMVSITCGTGAGDYAILQSQPYIRYIPGKSQFLAFSGAFSPGAVANNTCRTGYFDAENGVFLEVTNGVASVVRRSSASGSVVNDSVPQSAWNVDKLDGTGPSGLTIDLTKTQIMYMTISWLGRYEIGFNISGRASPVHRFLSNNFAVLPAMQSMNLPVRMESVNSAGSVGATIKFTACTVQSEGGQESRGTSRTASNGTTTTAVTTRRPVLSIRSAATIFGLTNRGHIESDDLFVFTKSNDVFWEVVYNGTLTGAAFASVGAGSIAEFDTAATAISGGTVLKSGYASSGTGSAAALVNVAFDPRIPLTISKIDGGPTVQEHISLVVTSMAATANVSCSANWFERF